MHALRFSQTFFGHFSVSSYCKMVYNDNAFALSSIYFVLKTGIKSNGLIKTSCRFYKQGFLFVSYDTLATFISCAFSYLASEVSGGKPRVYNLWELTRYQSQFIRDASTPSILSFIL